MSIEFYENPSESVADLIARISHVILGYEGGSEVEKARLYLAVVGSLNLAASYDTLARQIEHNIDYCVSQSQITEEQGGGLKAKLGVKEQLVAVPLTMQQLKEIMNSEFLTPGTAGAAQDAYEKLG